MTDTGRADIIEFLTEQYDEERRRAEDASARDSSWSVAEQAPRRWGEEGSPAQILAGGKPIITFGIEYGAALAVDHVVAHDPTRVLADIAAKRALLAIWQRADAATDSPGFHQLADDIVEQLLAPYGKRAVWTPRDASGPASWHLEDVG